VAKINLLLWSEIYDSGQMISEINGRSSSDVQSGV